jgi:short subunit dehydrogenase-like uncharacterized protein
MSAKRKFDVIVFGATGYTGGLVAQYLAKVSAQENLRWALAGRNLEKLEAVKQSLPKSGNYTEPALLQAEVNDAASINALAASATAIITTVGPYLQYGEPLLKACAEQGTHYVDLTGEPFFVQAMRQKYDAIAQKTSAKIVNSCGFESIPPDMAVLYAVNLLKERLGANNVANAKVVVHGAAEGFSMPSGGTWHSAVEAMAGARQWMRERKPLQSHRVGSINTPILYEKNWQRWALNAPTIDPDVVCYSAHLRGDYGKHFSYGHFIAAKQPFKLAGMVAGMSVVFTLAQFTPTKNWLLKQRQSGDGPSQAAREKGWFNMHVTAQAADEKVVVRLSGGDPFYGDTAKMLSEAALCLALDKNLPAASGIITPAAAMGEALIPRLERAGLRFRMS